MVTACRDSRPISKALLSPWFVPRSRMARPSRLVTSTGSVEPSQRRTAGRGHAEVGVAHARRNDSHDHLVRAVLVELDLDEVESSVLLLDDRRSDLHICPLSLRCAT
jgi:hypothetical protein